jgi:FlaA1/EpsC-like NDP-sugar epimerase
MPAVKAAVIAMDAGLTIFCFLMAFKLRENTAVFSSTAWAWSQAFVPYAGILYFAVPIRILMMVYERAYQYQGAFSYTRDAIKIFKAVAVGSLLITGWAFLFRGGYAFRDFSYSRGIFFLDFALALSLFVVLHLALRFAQARVRERGINLIPTLIVERILKLRKRCAN